MRRFIASLLVLLLTVFVLAAGALAWVVYTQSGLQWAIERGQDWTDGAMALEYESGTLRSGVDFKQVRYASEDLTLNAERVHIRVSPWSLLRLSPHIELLRAARLEINTRSDRDAASAPPSVPALPVPLAIDDAQLGELAIRHDGESTTLEDIRFRYAGGLSAHRIEDLRLRFEDLALRASGTVGTRRPHPVEVRAQVVGHAAQLPLSADISARGSLDLLALNVKARSAGANLVAAAEVEPAAALPVVRMDAEITGLDLRAIDAAMPQTALAGGLTLTREDKALTGSMQFSNEAAGPYDTGRLPVASVRGVVQTDLGQVDFPHLTIELPTGTLSGSASVMPARTQFALDARNVDLSALHGKMRSTQLSGDAKGMIAPERQSVNAHLAQDDMRLALKLERDGDQVTLHEGVLRARGGVATAHGKLTLDAQRRFTASAKLSRFDPAAWGNFPAGSINGTFAGKGSLEAPRGHVEFKLSDSRLHGAALSGSGRATLEAQRLTAADITLALGGNRAHVTGAFGAPNDTLSIDLNAPKLAVLHPDLAGSVTGQAQVSGTLEAPQVRFKARATALRAPDIVFKQANVQGTLSPEPTGPLRLDAEASGLVAGGTPIERLALQINGTQAAHTAALNAAGERFNVAARARGAWAPERNTWSGTVIELANRAPLKATLESPVAVSAAPDRIVVAPFTLRLLEGRIEAGETRYQAGRIATKGRYEAIPVLGVARALKFAPRVGGDLRLSGEWSFVKDGTLGGSFTARREAGDITLGPEGSRPIKLETLAVESRLDPAHLQFEAKLVSALANAAASGSVGVIAHDEGAIIGKASPLRFNARISVDELSDVAQFFDANALVNGALTATVTGRGTLGDPRLRGEIRGRRLALALPPQGVHLRNGSLHAVFDEDRLRVESLIVHAGEGTFRAHGSIGLGGENSTLDWQAERLLLLGRPDRRLIVSGQGRVGLANGKFFLSGGVRANQGYFEIGPDALPEPGRDVVIAGEKPKAAKETSSLERMALELVVNFGDAFHVRGRGLDTRLAGEILVATNPRGELRAKGTVRTVRGVYRAFGQRLEIDRGELIFSGPIDNPGLDILAMRKRQAVEAGVAVTGTLESPLVRIVSEPPVPESEAIAWLVLGHGTADASRGDLAMLPLAAGSLLGKGENRPTLAQRFGLDTLGLRGRGEDNQYLAVGKRIADRLYVGFEQSLGAAASILKLEFDLTQRLLLRAEAGESNSLGIFYRYTFD